MQNLSVGEHEQEIIELLKILNEMQAEDLVNHMGYKMSESALKRGRTTAIISNAMNTVDFAMAKLSRQESSKISNLKMVQNEEFLTCLA